MPSPSASRSPLAAAGATIAAVAETVPAKVLVVDDEPTILEIVGRYMERAGFETFGAADGFEALRLAEEHTPDLVVLDLMLPGIDGIDLIKVLRLRSQAGVIVVSGRLAPDVFAQVVDAGADMYLAKPVQFEQVALAIKAVLRRAGNAARETSPWQLDRRAKRLIAPDGAVVDLSDGDQAVMECFVEAAGNDVTRETLRHRLGQGDEDAADSLNATIYRLRRRIEKATPLVVPLQSKSRVGYVFRAPLRAL